MESLNKSLAGAREQGVAEAAQAVSGISGVKVTDWTAEVESN